MSAFARSAPGRLVRLPAFNLDRPRLLERISRERRVWVICGPAGFGKSTLAAQGVRASGGAWRYLRLSAGDEATAVFSQLICASGACAAPSLQNALDAVERAGLSNIVIDDADAAGASGREAIQAFCASLDHAVGVTLCARSIEAVIEPRWLCDATAEAIPWDALAFDGAEIRALCGLMDVRCNATDVDDFMRQTQGWPMVVSGALHAALRRHAPLSQALEIWESDCAKAFTDFVGVEARKSRHGAQFIAALSENRSPTSEDLDVWEREAFFVVRAGTTRELLAPVRRAFAAAGKASQSSSAPAPMVAQLFGELRVSINGIPVNWIRRKDAQVFKYLLLKESGLAKRREIMETFWRGRDPHIAAQNLRTTCSNIRRALRAVVGEECTEAYFRSDDDLCVALQNVITDVAEFQGHVNAARAGYAQRANRYASFHLERARELYRGELLVGMPQCGHEELAAELRRTFGELLHLLRTMPLERGPLTFPGDETLEIRASA